MIQPLYPAPAARGGRRGRARRGPGTNLRCRAAYPEQRRDVFDYGDLPTVNMVVRLVEQAAPVDELGL